MDTEEVVPFLHHRQVGEIVYDDTFTLEEEWINPATLEKSSYPLTFYMVLPQSAPFHNWAVEVFSRIEALTDKALEPGEPTLDVEEAYKQGVPVHQLHQVVIEAYLREERTRGRGIGEKLEASFNALILMFVVAWDFSPHQDRLTPCTLEGVQHLSMLTRRKIVEHVIERLRLWNML